MDLAPLQEDSTNKHNKEIAMIFFMGFILFIKFRDYFLKSPDVFSEAPHRVLLKSFYWFTHMNIFHTQKKSLELI